MNINFPVLKKIRFFENPKMESKSSKMAILYAEITEILYYYDPVGLAAIGAPEDEYESEAVSILHRLRDVEDKTELRLMVHDVFASWFSESSALPNSDTCYREITEDIWEAWQTQIAHSEGRVRKEVNKKSLKEEVNDILYKHDPLILRKFGVPDDEYTSEASDIILHLEHASDVRSLKWSIYEVFLNYFSKESIAPYGDERYQYIAEKIWDLWQKGVE